MKKSIFEIKYWVIIIAVICSLLWGSAFPVLKLSYMQFGINTEDIMGKIMLAGIRFSSAGLVILLFSVFVMKESIKIDKISFLKLLSLGVVQTSLQYFFFYVGLANTTGIKASLLTTCGTFFTVIFSHFIYKNDKLNYFKIGGLIAGFSGVVLVNLGKSFDTSFNIMGEGFLIIVGLVNAFGTIMAKSMSKKMHPFLISGYQMMLGGTILMSIPILSGQKINLNFTTTGTFLLIYAIMISAIAFSLWYSLLKHNKAGEITIYKFIIPVSGTFMSALFLGEETLNVQILFAMALVSMGVVFINRKSKLKEKSI